jgi:hypothetical protein
MISPTQITATVPATATSGQIQVTTPGGVATSTGSFSVTPVINSFLPTSGPVGTSVVISGTTFVGVTGVLFNGQLAAYTVNSPTQITATVPPSTTGPIEVTVWVPGAAVAGTWIDRSRLLGPAPNKWAEARPNASAPPGVGVSIAGDSRQGFSDSAPSPPSP